MHYAVLPGLKLSPEVAKNGSHFVIKSSRLSSVIQDVETAGMDLTPIHGPPEVAWPILASRFTKAMMGLPDAKRLLEDADVMYDDDPWSADTGTWFDHITPGALCKGEGGMEVLAQWANLMPFIFSKEADDGRGSEAFSSILKQIEGSVGIDISEWQEQAQAAAIVAWFKRTRPPKGYAVWVDPMLGTPAELVRRSAATPMQRFEPLFEAGWRACIPLSELWPQPVEDVATAAMALATSLEIGGANLGVTPALLMALGVAVENLLPYATKSTNAERQAQILGAKHMDEQEELGEEAKGQLQRDIDFQTLKQSIDSCATGDFKAMAKVMLEAKHGAGLLFLNSKFAPDTYWKEKAAARTESCVMSIFNDALSKDTSGDVMQWGPMLPDGFSKKVIGGKFTSNWWALLKVVLTKRYGQCLVSQITTRIKGLPDKALWSDTERLRLLEWPMKVIMRLIKMDGGDTWSWSTFYASLLRMALAIEGIPSKCTPKRGLQNKLQEAVETAMRCAQDRMEEMLATPATAVKRVPTFLIDGRALDALRDVDERIKRTLKEIEDGFWGLSKDPAFNADDEWPETELGRRGKKRQREREREAQKAQWQKTDDAWQDPRGVVWGSALKEHGAYATEDGKHIAFGREIVCYGDNAPDASESCLACFAPGKLYARGKWCPTPGKCWGAAGEAAHERTAEQPDSVCKPLTTEAASALDWETFTTMLHAPGGGGGAPSAHRRGGGGGGGKRSKGGKGKGAGKGKGKGKGKGGNGKGGKGKGGKGNGSAHFARQW